MKAHVSLENVITFLLSTSMFENLDPVEIKEIAHLIETLRFQPGETVFEEGTPGDSWYAVYRGEVAVVKQSAGGEDSIRTLGPGACFGEIAVLDGAPRSATVRANTETTALRFPRDRFLELLQQEHLVAYKLIKHMALMFATMIRDYTETLCKLHRADDLSQVRSEIDALIGRTSFRDRGLGASGV
jgi:CRP-like cAMP-binding protein